MRLNQRINHGEIVGYYPVLRDMCELGGESDQYTHLPCYTLVSVRVFYTHLLYTSIHLHTTLSATHIGGQELGTQCEVGPGQAQQCLYTRPG